MEAHHEQQKAKKKQQCLMSQAAKERNAQILKVSLLCAVLYIYCAIYLYDTILYSKQGATIKFFNDWKKKIFNDFLI